MFIPTKHTAQFHSMKDQHSRRMFVHACWGKSHRTCASRSKRDPRLQLRFAADCGYQVIGWWSFYRSFWWVALRRYLSRSLHSRCSIGSSSNSSTRARFWCLGFSFRAAFWTFVCSGLLDCTTQLWSRRGCWWRAKVRLLWSISNNSEYTRIAIVCFLVWDC